ncbi:MAG: ATP-binding protein [Spirochaetales bacterium]|nr:ATP-binding protein [Spirochaetales bacterium]
MSKEIHTDGNLITRLFFRLLPIQILLAAINAVNSTISSLFAANSIGPAAMSAIGFYTPINTLMFAMTGLFVCGSQIICGKFMGANQMEKTQNVFSVDLLSASLFSFIYIALHLLAVPFGWMRIFTKDPEVLVYLNQYVLGRAIDILPYVLGQQLAAFLSLENKTKRTTIASVTFIFVNLVTNYLFVSRWKMQAFGLALASSVGLWVFCLIELAYYFKKSAMMKFRLKGVKGADFVHILKTGFPGAMSDGYQTARALILNAIIPVYAGSAGVSAFSTANSFIGLFWTIPGAMLVVSRMLMSVSIGEEDRRSLTDVMRHMFKWSIPIMAAIGVTISLLAEPITNLYYHDPTAEVYKMTVWGMRLLPLVFPLALPTMNGECYAQTSGKQVLINIMTAWDGVVGVVAFSALLMPAISINGVYWANILNSIFADMILLGYAIIKCRRFPRSMDDYMVIPADFGVSENDRIDMTVKNMEDVMTVSMKVSEFCNEKGIDCKRTYLASLCLEELAGNVVDHGFHKDKKIHSVDIRVAKKNDELILRLKDDCVKFDPAARKDMLDPEDPAKNIGIRMVYGMTDKIEYHNILGLNVITIRI